MGTSPSPMETPLPIQHLLLFLHFFGCFSTKNSFSPLWPHRAYGRRSSTSSGLTSSSVSADHTNLVARPFIPLSSTSELHQAVLDFKKDTSQTQPCSCSVPTPLSQSDFAEIRGVTSADSQAGTSRRQGKKSLFADPSREEDVTVTQVWMCSFFRSVQLC